MIAICSKSSVAFLARTAYFRVAAMAACCLLSVAGSTRVAEADDVAGIAFFEQKIRPLLAEHCYPCHSSKAEKLKGGLLLDSRAGWQAGGDSGEPVIVVGTPDESTLLTFVKHEGGNAMPPDYKLPDQAIADLREWIAMGAPDPRDQIALEVRRADKSWWSLQKLDAIEPPIVEAAAWNQNPIDQFIASRLNQDGLTPNPPADPRTLIRRMSYDMLGLPPTPEEVTAFVSDCQVDRKQAIERLVDRLLQSPQYGERWGRHWLDVVRFGESNGFERNVINDDAWPFRDYVIRSINEDKPFNQFILEHLAGDVIGKNDPQAEIGSAFLVVGPYDDVGNQDVVAQANIRAATLDDIVTATGSAFLGLTIHCARCHHHKFDPIPTQDYYRLRAAFEGIHHGSRVVATHAERDEHRNKTEPLQKEQQAIEAEIAAIQKQIDESAKQPSGSPPNPQTDVSQTPAESSQALQNKLTEFRERLQAVQQQIAAVPPLRQVWIGNHSQPGAPTRVHQGGDPMKPLEEIKPAGLEVLSSIVPAFELAVDAPESERRLALGRWIVSDENALTARVLANRVWHYHFGTGIVDTPSDFGFLGGKPSHPELLDWLATRLIDHQWRLKPLHRDILLSQTYQQSSSVRDEAANIDNDARLLWRFPPRRLTGEELRDTLLFVTGKLDLKMGGPGFRLYLFTQNNVCTYLPLDQHGPETYRRAVYHQNARASVVDLLTDFDQPDNAFSAPRRSTTTSPLQSLTLLNHSFTLDMARELAGRAGGPSDPGDQARFVESVFQYTIQRSPTDKEQAAALHMLEKHGPLSLCRAMLNLNELLFVE